MKSEFCYPVAKILPSNLLSIKPSDLGVANDLVTQGQLFLNFLSATLIQLLWYNHVCLV